MVSFTEAARLGVVNCINFTGRSSRSEYWWLILALFLAQIAAGILIGIVPFLSILAIPLNVLVFFASTSALFRRVRDAGWPAMLPIGIYALTFVLAAVFFAGMLMLNETMMMVASALGIATLLANLYLLYVLVQPSEDY